MANRITGRHLRIDTAGATSIISGQQLRVIGFAWTGIASNEIADDDDLEIEDETGVEIFEKRAAAAGDGVEPTFFYPPLLINGLNVTAMDHGIVRIWLAEEVKA